MDIKDNKHSRNHYSRTCSAINNDVYFNLFHISWGIIEFKASDVNTVDVNVDKNVCFCSARKRGDSMFNRRPSPPVNHHSRMLKQQKPSLEKWIRSTLTMHHHQYCSRPPGGSGEAGLNIFTADQTECFWKAWW